MQPKIGLNVGNSSAYAWIRPKHCSDPETSVALALAWLPILHLSSAMKRLQLRLIVSWNRAVVPRKHVSVPWDRTAVPRGPEAAPWDRAALPRERATVPRIRAVVAQNPEAVPRDKCKCSMGPSTSQYFFFQQCLSPRTEKHLTRTLSKARSS